MRYDPSKEYEVRVPCDRHGVVWALVTRRYRFGDPEACVCPDCAAEADAVSARTGRDVLPEEMLFASRIPDGQARVRDAARTAAEALERAGAGIVPAAGAGRDDSDDGE